MAGRGEGSSCSPRRPPPCTPRARPPPPPPRPTPSATTLDPLRPAAQFYQGGGDQGGGNSDLFAGGFLIALLYLAFKLFGALETLG